MTTKAEREHMGKIAGMACVVCHLMGRTQESRTEVHHLREGVGMSQRQSNFLTIPLCVDDHRGANGIHGDKSYMHTLKVDELGLLAVTIELLADEREFS